MDRHEMRFFFRDLNETVSEQDIDTWFEKADIDESGYIEFKELVEATKEYLHTASTVQDASLFVPHQYTTPILTNHGPTQVCFSDENNEEDEDEDEEDIPDDLACLSPDEQQRRIKWRATWMMALGTLTVLFFSDPMVGCLSELGARTGIPAFYISFVLAPLASNASELLAAYNYATKKTRKTISISIATLLGAACMNNTFCLGIFMALMAFKGDLAWEFTAETVAILIVEGIMGILALRKTHTLGSALFVACVFPASLVLVLVLENVFGLD